MPKHPCRKCPNAILFCDVTYCRKYDQVIREDILVLPCGRLVGGINDPEKFRFFQEYWKLLREARRVLGREPGPEERAMITFMALGNLGVDVRFLEIKR